MFKKVMETVSKKETIEIAQHIQIAYQLLQKAQDGFEQGDAIRGGIYAASTKAFLETIIKKVNFLAPMQMSLLPDGEGKDKVSRTVDEATAMIEQFEKLWKEKQENNGSKTN